MTRGDEVFRAIQSSARAEAIRTGQPVATGELLTRHLLESFIDRLNRTPHGRDFVLKGGVLVGAYGARRATKDIDANAVSADVTEATIAEVARAVAGVMVDDGVSFDLSSLSVLNIRDEGAYPGLRLRMNAEVGTFKGVTAWDVTTGDPIVPAPREVRLERVFGPPLMVLGYSVESILAEKGVTILERGATSTRWRDYVDIVQLCERGFDPVQLREAAETVAAHRQVALGAVAPHLADYASMPVAQAKWAAWRRKERLDHCSEPQLLDQVGKVAAHLDPIFGGERDD